MWYFEYDGGHLYGVPLDAGQIRGCSASIDGKPVTTHPLEPEPLSAADLVAVLQAEPSQARPFARR